MLLFHTAESHKTIYNNDEYILLTKILTDRLTADIHITLAGVFLICHRFQSKPFDWQPTNTRSHVYVVYVNVTTQAFDVRNNVKILILI